MNGRSAPRTSSIKASASLFTQRIRQSHAGQQPSSACREGPPWQHAKLTPVAARSVRAPAVYSEAFAPEGCAARVGRHVMRPSTASRCTVVVTALLVAAGCGTHQPRSETRVTSGTSAQGAATTTASADAAASRTVAAVVARMGTSGSTRMVEVQRRGVRTLTMSGWQVWGKTGGGLDVMVPPADLGLQNLNHSDRMEMRSTGGSEYLSIDPGKSGTFKGRHWLRYSEAAVLGGDINDAMNEAAERSPIAALGAPAAAGRVALIGRETVDGKPAVHYRASIAADPRIVALKHVPATTQADLWVGQDGYPVRYVSDDGRQRNTLDFQSFGGTHVIPIPPASDLIDMSNKATANTPTPA